MLVATLPLRSIVDQGTYCLRLRRHQLLAIRCPATARAAATQWAPGKMFGSCMNFATQAPQAAQGCHGTLAQGMAAEVAAGVACDARVRRSSPVAACLCQDAR